MPIGKKIDVDLLGDEKYGSTTKLYRDLADDQATTATRAKLISDFNPQPLINYINNKYEEVRQRAIKGDPAARQALERYAQRQKLGASLIKAVVDDMVERASKGDSEAKRWLVERDRRMPIGKKIDVDLLGDEKYGSTTKLYRDLADDQATTAARAKLVSDTKTRLQALVNAATAGDKKAQSKWETAKSNYAKAKVRAAKGDAKAKDVVSVLEATGLFS
jgi:hypothetical protein